MNDPDGKNAKLKTTSKQRIKHGQEEEEQEEEEEEEERDTNTHRDRRRNVRGRFGYVLVEKCSSERK